MLNHADQVASLMDEQLDGAAARRALNCLGESPEARQMWARYHLARHLLREAECPVSFDAGFADRVSRSIEAEPRCGLPSARKRTFQDAPVVRWAIAASVAALAVLAVQKFQFAGVDYGERMLVMASNPELRREADLHAEAEERLRNYLAMHNESIQVAGSGNLLSSARVVSYSSPHPWDSPSGPGYARPQIGRTADLHGAAACQGAAQGGAACNPLPANLSP
jgi:sigma-E factor negative regulatory protein RseA